MYKQLWPAIAVVLLVAVVVGWRFLSGAGDSARGERTKAPPSVSAASASLQTLDSVFRSVGSVESPQRVELTPKVQGVVEFLQVHPGDSVRRGQVLVRLDRGELEDNVNKCRAELAQAQARLAEARLTQVSNDASVSSGLRQQKAAVTTATAELEMVRESSRASVASAEADLRNAQAEANNAEAKYRREAELYRQAFTARQDFDDAKTQHLVAIGKKEAAAQSLKSTKAKAEADVKVAQAKLTQAEAALDHAEAVKVEMPAYRQSLSALEAVVSAAKASLASAQVHLADTVLRSPLDGFVTERLLDQGGLAKSGEAILTLQTTNELWVNVSVPSEIRDKLDVNSPVELTLKDGGLKKSAKILNINAAASEEDRQFRVRILMPSSLKVSPGMFVTAYLILERHEHVLAVPKAALNQSEGKTFVWLVKSDSTVERRPVKVGFETASYSQILSGLSSGDKVVTLSGVTLKDGQAVTVEEESASTDQSSAAQSPAGESSASPASASSEAAGSASASSDSASSEAAGSASASPDSASPSQASPASAHSNQKGQGH